MKIYEKLQNIQLKLNCPKGQFNSFGGFSFRSCEDILEAAKPVLKEIKASLVVGDEIVMIGDRFYVKAMAALIDTETGEKISNTAFAREPESKKGMDASQVTGMASSYARKYALSGLLCLDDNKDSDSVDNTPKPGGLGETSIASLKKELARTGVSERSMLKNYGADTLHDLSPEDFEDAMKILKEKPDKEKAVNALGGTKNE